MMSTEDDTTRRVKAIAARQKENSSNAKKYSAVAFEELHEARRLIRVIRSRDVPKKDAEFLNRLRKLDKLLETAETATDFALVAFETHGEAWRKILESVEQIESDSDTSPDTTESSGTDDRPKLSVLNGGRT